MRWPWQKQAEPKRRRGIATFEIKNRPYRIEYEELENHGVWHKVIPVWTNIPSYWHEVIPLWVKDEEVTWLESEEV